MRYATFTELPATARPTRFSPASCRMSTGNARATRERDPSLRAVIICAIMLPAILNRID